MGLSMVVNGKLDVSDFIISATISGNTAEIMRTINMQLQASDLGRTPTYSLNVGDKISVRDNGKLLMLAIIFEVRINNSGQYDITAYDTNVYLSQSTDSRVFLKKKASDIVKILAKDYGIQLGEIADTKYIIPRYMPANKSLATMIFSALKLTRDQLSSRYFVGNISGKLTVYPITKSKRYLFKSAENLISAEYSQSIQETKTQVKVVGGAKGKETVVTAKNETMIKKYGTMQAFEQMDEKATTSQIKQRATTMLKELARVEEQLTISALLVNEVDVGTAVYIRNPMTKTNGAYYVSDITKKYEGSNRTMDMTVVRTFELPDITIDDDELKLPEK